MKSAYLIVICNPTTNAIESAEVWSTPEWEQSRCLAYPTYVAWRVERHTFARARDDMIDALGEPMNRYHWLKQYLGKSRPDAAMA